MVVPRKRAGPRGESVDRPAPPKRGSNAPPEASSAEALARMKASKRRDTKPELLLRSALHRAGLRFRVDKTVPPLTRRRADVVFARERIVVFVDGCFWHGCPEHATWPKANADWWREKIHANRRRDLDTDARLRGAGWTVIRVWEHASIEEAAVEVVDAVRAARAVHASGRSSSARRG